MGLLAVRDLIKSYRSPEGERQEIVRVPQFDVDAGSEVGLRGESGSGKTTFVHLLGGIVRPDSGSVRFAEREITTMSEQAVDQLRAQEIGYIFQSFNLLQGFTCLENLRLALAFGGKRSPSDAEALLKRVGLEHRLHHYPRQLSTGQQQRVAVARALVNRPKLVLADEPTGNLDRRNATAAIELIREICRESGAALVLVSHDADTLAHFADVRDFGQINAAQAKAEASR